MKLGRRDFLVRSSAALAAAPLARLIGHAQQAAPAAVTPVFSELRRNVGIFTARGGTIGYVINKDAALVVDTQYPDTAQLCVDGLRKKTSRQFDVVFNTHHHADHTGGNGVFKPLAKKIVAQARVPELQRMAATGAAPTAPPVVLPDATFDTAWGEHIGNERVTASYNGPGHTGGDAIVHFEKAHVVHMGDLLFHEVHPRVDRPAGASIRNWIVILEKAAKQFPADTIYIAGHAMNNAPAVGRAAVLRFRDYLTEVLSFTQQAIAAGQSREALAAATALPGFENVQALGVLTLKGVLESAYDELTAKAP